MLNMCVTWGWIIKCPVLENFPEPKKRIRWIFPTEALSLIQAVPQQWLKDACAFDFATGLREDELYGLEWPQVNLDTRTAWIESDQAKSGRARSIPLNDDAMSILKRRQGSHPRYVFTRNGNRIYGGDDRMFKAALDVAGKLQVPRYPAHLGKLAFSVGHALDGAQRTGRMGNHRNGTEVRPPRAYPPCAPRK